MIKIPTMSRPSIAYFGVLLAILATGITIVIGNIPSDDALYTDQTTPTSQQAIQGVVDATTETTNNDTQQSSAVPLTSTPSATNPSSRVTTTPSSNTSQPVTQQPVTTVTATLNVNGNEKGNVALPAGSNHCDVLSKALSTGLIQSLDMRYDTTYKTNGVYGINGQGSSNTVWWVFEVNGKSPPYGCSNIPVKDNDRVNWKYIRS